MVAQRRKTVEVGFVLEAVNTHLAAPNTTPDARGAMINLLESVLFETDNYMGFRYLDKDDYPNEVDGMGTRRYYYPSWKVQEYFERKENDAA
jgi:hypothetical protein